MDRKIISSTTVKRAFWFLRHPKLYREAFRRLGRKTGIAPINHSTMPSSKAASEAESRAYAMSWCEENYIDLNTLILKITGTAEIEYFNEKFTELVAIAKGAVKNCPTRRDNPDWLKGVSEAGLDPLLTAANLDLIYHLTEHTQATRVIETGVDYGWSSLAFLLSLKNRPNSVLISTDRPDMEKNEKCIGCTVPIDLRSNWKMIKLADKEALPQALKILPTIDICHYDSDKSYEGRLWAYPKLWKALRIDGIFISDDVGDNLGFHDFCNQIKKTPLIIKSSGSAITKYVGVLVKD